MYYRHESQLYFKAVTFMLGSFLQSRKGITFHTMILHLTPGNFDHFRQRGGRALHPLRSLHISVDFPIWNSGFSSAGKHHFSGLWGLPICQISSQRGCVNFKYSEQTVSNFVTLYKNHPTFASQLMRCSDCKQVCKPFTWMCNVQCIKTEPNEVSKVSNLYTSP